MVKDEGSIALSTEGAGGKKEREDLFNSKLLGPFWPRSLMDLRPGSGPSRGDAFHVAKFLQEPLVLVDFLRVQSLLLSLHRPLIVRALLRRCKLLQTQANASKFLPPARRAHLSGYVRFCTAEWRLGA